MADDSANPAPQAEEPEVADKKEVADKPAEAEEEVSEEQLSDALGDDVKGKLTVNEGSEELAEAEEPEEAAEETEGSEELEGVEEEQAEEEVEEPAAETEAEEGKAAYTPEQVDPGEFTPAGDYSFEVKTLDGQAHKISTSKEADAFAAMLDKNPEAISASQFVDFNRGLARMERMLDTERWAWEGQKKAYDDEQLVVQARNATLSQWDKEVKYLRQRGDLPEISSELNNADWDDTKVAQEPAVKETVELFNWMEEENNRREKVGLDSIKSALDAFEIREAQQLRQELKGTKDKEVKVRQAKGAMVGGTTPHVPSNAPKDTIIGEGGSLDDLMLEYSQQ